LQNSPTPQKYLIETMPGGVALLDYNNDGLLDIFLVNGGRVTSPMPTPENFDRKNLNARTQPTNPAHRLTAAIDEGIYSKVPSQGICPTQSSWARALLLSQQGKQSGAGLSF
jgi:hypothetical protein